MLGEGGFAQVIKGTHRITGAQVAIKSIDLCKIQVRLKLTKTNC